MKASAQTPALWEFPGGPVVTNPASSAGDTGLILEWAAKTPHASGAAQPRGHNQRGQHAVAV